MKTALTPPATYLPVSAGQPGDFSFPEGSLGKLFSDIPLLDLPKHLCKS